MTTLSATGQPEVTQFIYNATAAGSSRTEMLGKPYQVIDPLGYITQYDYDRGGLYSVTDPLGNNTSAQFNHYDQPISLAQPDRVLTWQYGDGTGKEPTIAVSRDSHTLQTVDLLGLLHDNEYGVTSISGQEIIPSSQTFDNEYGLKQVTDGDQYVMHTFTSYPYMNKSQYMIGSAGLYPTTWTQTLNQDGNIASFVGPYSSGTVQRVGPSYPPSGIAIQGNQANNQNLSYTYAYAYDGFARVVGSTASSPSGSVSHAYTYDDEDHVTRDQVTINNGAGYVITYQYAPNGLRTSMSVNGFTFNYTYSLRNNLTSINTPGSQYAGASYFYDADSRVVEASTTDGATFYQYDGHGRVTLVENLTPDGIVTDPNHAIQDPLNGNWHSIYSMFDNIQYDQVDHRNSMNFHVADSSGSSSQFHEGYVSYVTSPFLGSEVWRQQSPTSKEADLYNYMDNGGNMTSVRSQSFPNSPFHNDYFGGAPGLWQLYGDIAYDPAGNETNFRGLVATYDMAGQLSTLAVPSGSSSSSVRSAATTGSVTSTMLYDAEGHRIQRQIGALKYEFMYDGDTLVCHDGTFYVWGPTGPIQEINGYYGEATYNFDPNGNTVDRVGSYFGSYLPDDAPELYDGFGEPAWPQQLEPGSPSCPTDLNGLEFRYKGQAGYFTDTDSDLIYCHHRYYDPLAARWITRDPTGLDGGINTYQYCDDDPLTSADPSGSEACAVLEQAARAPLRVVQGGTETVAPRLIPGVGWAVVAAEVGWRTGRAIDEHFGLSDEVLAENSGANAFAAADAADPNFEWLKRLWRNSADSHRAELEEQYPFLKSYGQGYRRRMLSTVRHHMLPQQFRPQFEKAKFVGSSSIDSPQYIKEMTWSDHQKLHGKGGVASWNAQWKEFFDSNPNPSKTQILRKLRELRAHFGI